MGFAMKQAALQPVLESEDLRSIFAQPDWTSPHREGDMFTTPERTPSQVDALREGAGDNLAAGLQSPITPTGAPAAPHAGRRGDTTAFDIVRQTLGSAGRR